MTEKQEVIEYFKKQIDICLENAEICDDNNFDEEAMFLRKQQYMYETVLNMLKEKDKEIEMLKDIKEIADTKVTELRKIKEVDKLESENWILQVKLQEKDKEIEKLKRENEHWKNEFEKELEDNRKNTCELLKQDLIIRKKDRQIDLMAEYINKIDVSEEICEEKTMCDENCKECVKQYFKSKAEKE